MMSFSFLTHFMNFARFTALYATIFIFWEKTPENMLNNRHLPFSQPLA